MEIEKLPTVLIVDDEPHLNGAIRLTFEDSDFEVYSAYSGEEGFELLDRNRIDVCIVDMRLPDTTGNEFITAVHDNNPEMRFVIYTGSIDYAIPKNLQSIGITEEQVFIKPIKDFSKLVNVVVKIFENK